MTENKDENESHESQLKNFFESEKKIKFEDAFYGRIFLFSGVLEILCQSDRIYNSKGLNNESNT